MQLNIVKWKRPREIKVNKVFYVIVGHSLFCMMWSAQNIGRIYNQNMPCHVQQLHSSIAKKCCTHNTLAATNH